jgi:formate hydrogenlyase subunit 3/multisubunit Na+/H+ antiporter MnhD subunit
MKTRSIAIALLLLTHASALACSVCEKQQPKVLRGITHGAGPQSNWDYLIIAIVVIIALISLVYSIKYILQPGERQKEHIKYIILNNPAQ